MNMAHLHLLLNHFPIIGTIIGLALFLISFAGKGEETRRASYIVFAAIALLSIPTFFSGYGAQVAMKKDPAISAVLVVRHQSSALLSIWFMEITGTLALVGLWQSQGDGRPKRWNVLAVLLFSLLTVGLMARTGNTGGDIRHPEIWAGQEVPAESSVGAFIHTFEPAPDKFSAAMVSSKWWWAFMMDLHFLGLALIVGAVGILDIRIMGFAKQMPIAPLHKFVPWALAGLGINVLTGLLGFIGSSEQYILDEAFWLKMVALMLLGVNVAAFYLTGIFEKVEALGPGEDAPMSAKLVAASSLFLWAAVITLGRYIQPFADSITLIRPQIPGQ
jgi:uncharacterized membrane protein